VVAFALYPQGALHASEPSVKAATAPVTQAGAPAARAEVEQP
jgi:hypothetical protein